MQTFWIINSTHKWRSTTKYNELQQHFTDLNSNLNVFWTSYNLSYFMLTLILLIIRNRIVILIQVVVNRITLFPKYYLMEKCNKVRTKTMWHCFEAIIVWLHFKSIISPFDDSESSCLISLMDKSTDWLF